MIQEIVSEEEQMNYIVRWPIVHTRYKELQRYDYDLNEYSLYGREGGFTTGTSPLCIDLEVAAYEGIGEIPNEKKEWIDRVVKLAEEENVNYILSLSNYTTVISLDGDYKTSTLDLYGKLESFDLEYEYLDGGKWIIEDGQVISRIEGDDLKPYYFDPGEDVMRVQNFSNENELSSTSSVIMIDGIDQGISSKGFSILIYDKLLHKVIDVKSWY